MEIKTCEEYVIREFENAKEMISVLLEKNKELTEKLEQRSIEELPKEDLPKSKTYTVSEQPNYYYYFNRMSYYDYNEMLLQNNKTPEYLRKVLNGEESYEEFCKLSRERTLGTEYNGKVCQCAYDFLIVNYYGKKAVVYTSYDDGLELRNVDDNNYFLSAELAEEKMKKEVFNQLEYYFKAKYDEKFKPEVESKDGE